MEDKQLVVSASLYAVQVGVGIGESLRQALSRFYGVLNELRSDSGEKSLKKVYKELQGKKYTNEGKFILSNKYKGSNDFLNTSVSHSELKEFEKLCKEYGIDYLFQKRPSNLDVLYEKKLKNEPLSKNQENILNAFTESDAHGNLTLKNDAALITFSANDIDIMEKVVDKLEEKAYNIEQRKIKAEKTVQKAKEKMLNERTKKKIKEKSNSVKVTVTK